MRQKPRATRRGFLFTRPGKENSGCLEKTDINVCYGGCQVRAIRARYRLYRSKITAAMRANAAIEAEAGKANLQRIYWTAPVMTLTLLGVGVFHAFTRDATSPVLGIWRRQAMLANFLISVGSLLLWFVAAWLRRRQDHVRALRCFQYSVVAFVLASGIVNSIIDQSVLISVTPILLVSTIVGTFYYLRPSRSVLVFISFGLCFHLSMLYLSDLPVSVLWVSQSNGFVAVALGFSLSIANWRNFRRGEEQKQKIKAQQAILERLAYQDPLTGLPNRRFLDQVVKAELKRIERDSSECCLIMFDLDEFKEINDTFGHPVGDQVLCDLAKLLQESMRGSDILVRLGGEEFIIFASNTPLHEAAKLAERLRRQLAEHIFVVHGCKVRTSASFGVAPLFVQQQAKNYYYFADQALYQAKRRGKNRVAVWEEDLAEVPL